MADVIEVIMIDPPFIYWNQIIYMGIIVMLIIIGGEIYYHYKEKKAKAARGGIKCQETK